jgi:hypothetical protein
MNNKILIKNLIKNTLKLHFTYNLYLFINIFIYNAYREK